MVVFSLVAGQSLCDGDGCIWEEGVLAALEHASGKVSHDWLGLDGEVAEHFVRTPSSKQFNGVRVNVGTKEGHGTRGAEGVCADFFGGESDGRSQRTDGCL